MDANAAEKAYMPDKGARKEPIVVGLSGGIKSYVTASLLKIQRYDVIGVTVQNDPAGFSGAQEKVVRCHSGDQKLDEIRLFCRSLGVPHFVVKSGPEFQEEVVESWKSSRILGTLPRQCRSCHGLRIRILYREMQRLGVKKLATGHLGKIFIQNNRVFLRSSNDEKVDQSGLLSDLPDQILRSLLLPLSDLQYTEILRLAENFDLVRPGEDHGSCFPNTQTIQDYLEATIPPELRKSGTMVLKNGDKYDDHEGVQDFVFGAPVDPKETKNEKLFIDYDYAAKEITLGTPEDFECREFFIESESLAERGSLLEPSPGFARFGGPEVECWISPKSLNRIHVELKATREVKSGETVSIFMKPGRNSKLLVSGRVLGPLYESETETDGEDGETPRARSGYQR